MQKTLYVKDPPRHQHTNQGRKNRSNVIFAQQDCEKR